MVPARNEVKRILCPVDLSELSGAALERAVRLGRWFDARVEVLHVVPRLPVVEAARAERARARLAIESLVAPPLGGSVRIGVKVLEGDPGRVILEEAESLPADLLVMGTHGRSGFEHLLLGSVTEKVLRRAHCPLLTVRNVSSLPYAGSPFRRILCATDLTPASAHTVETGFSLASENDARLALLHVLDPHQAATSRRDMELTRNRLRNTIPEAGRSF